MKTNFITRNTSEGLFLKHTSEANTSVVGVIFFPYYNCNKSSGIQVRSEILRDIFSDARWIELLYSDNFHSL